MVKQTNLEDYPFSDICSDSQLDDALKPTKKPKEKPKTTYISKIRKDLKEKDIPYIKRHLILQKKGTQICGRANFVGVIINHSIATVVIDL